MPKRSVIIGALLLAMFSGLMIKIYHLADSGLAQVADQQSTVTVTVATARGTIYVIVDGREDCFHAVVGIPAPRTV